MNMVHFLQEILDIPLLGGKFRSWVENSGLVWKIPVSGRKFPVSGGIFQDKIIDNYPGRFRRRQVVVLQHNVPGPEFWGILFAVRILSDLCCKPCLELYLIYSESHCRTVSGSCCKGVRVMVFFRLYDPWRRLCLMYFVSHGKDSF